MSESTAWILDFGNSVRAAVGELELVHLIGSPKLFAVPKTPDYCHQTLIWQDIIVPVIDLASGVQGQTNIPGATTYAAIVRYRPEQHGSLTYAALLLAAMPVRMSIDDSLACPLPEQPKVWKLLATSCFSLDGEAIPIIELSSIFSATAQTILGKEKIK